MDFAMSFLISILWWVLLLPAVIIAATPFILLMSLIGTPVFDIARVGENYRRVIRFWSDWGYDLVNALF